MMDRSPEWELVTRMGESRCGSAILFIHEAEPFKGCGARPNAFIAHERELRYGEPIAPWDMMAIRGGVWNHDFARSADFFEWLCVSDRIGISIMEKWLAYESDRDSDGQSPL